MAISMVQIRGHYEDAHRTLRTGTVTLTPSFPISNGTTTITGIPVTTDLVNGNISVTVAAGNDTGTTPTGMVYQVAEILDVPNKPPLVTTYNITVSAADAAAGIDLATAPRSVVSQPTYAAYLTQITGDARYVPYSGGTMTGALALPALKMTTGPANGSVLTSDGSGNASWQAPSTDWFNVKVYGAKGDGTTDDTTAIQNAINAAQTAGGGVVYFPAGTYPVNPAGGTALRVTGNGIRLVGASRRTTTIRKSGSGTLLSMSGPSTDASGATHVRYCTIQDMTLNGNGTAGLILELFYTDNCVFQNLFFTSNADVCVSGAEFWDSHFINCIWESSGGAANAVMPNVLLRNSAASSGYGYSADNVNMIRFYACRWENFYNGALRIEQGVNNTNTANGIYVLDCKMETSQMRGGAHLVATSATRAVYVDGLYCYAGGFFSGYSTPQNIITWSTQHGVLENVLIANSGATATINSAVDLFSGSGGTAVLRNVIGTYTTAPTGNHIFFESSTGDFNIQNSYSSNGSQIGGTIPTRYVGQSPLTQVAGPVSDGAFTRAQPNGAIAIDTTNKQLYMRIAGVWTAIASAPGDFTTAGNLIANVAGKGLQVKEGTNAKMGTLTLTGATPVVVATTAVTATSRIYLTTNVPGGTPGFCWVSARTAGTSFTVTGTAADTSTVAWMIVEPA